MQNFLNLALWWYSYSQHALALGLIILYFANLSLMLTLSCSIANTYSLTFKSQCLLPLALKLSSSCLLSLISTLLANLISQVYYKEFVILHSLILIQSLVNLFMLLIICLLNTVHATIAFTHASSLIYFRLQPTAIKHPLHMQQDNHI